MGQMAGPQFVISPWGVTGHEKTCPGAPASRRQRGGAGKMPALPAGCAPKKRFHNRFRRPTSPRISQITWIRNVIRR